MPLFSCFPSLLLFGASVGIYYLQYAYVMHLRLLTPYENLHLLFLPVFSKKANFYMLVLTRQCTGI